MSGEVDPADRRFMEQALALAALGEGTTSPNPRVGCVLVRDGLVVGSGYHLAPGLPHAEARAVEQAGTAARGSTLYVNLEPCAHHGRTPPCCDRIVEAGVERVVAGVLDPNPLVNGRGFRCLREAGIEVRVGLLEDQARRLNEAFLHWHRTGRPRVTVKAAVTLDGMLSAAGGESRWITGEPARRFAHRLRLRHDAVLVGAGTVRRDNPRLSVRLPTVDASRLRAVLAPDLRVPPDARVFGSGDANEPATRVYVREDLPERVEREFRGRAEIVRVPHLGGSLDLARVLDDLGSAGVQSLLVEGGGRTAAAFVAAGLVDGAALFVAPKLLGARGGTPLLDLASVPAPESAFTVEVQQRVQLGSDLLVLGRLRR